MWVPPKVHDEASAARQQFEGALPQALEVKERLEYWDRLLQDIDPYLTIVKARTNADTPGVRPGYYHVVRNNPGSPPNLMVVENPDGSFREPDSAMLEQLRNDDMWNDRALSARQKRELEVQRSKENSKERDREDRVDEFSLRLKAKTNPSMWFGGRGWTARKG